MEELSEQLKTAQRDEICSIIYRVLEAPGVYVFNEFLKIPNIIQLKETEKSNYYNTLKLFSCGMYNDYINKTQDYIELNSVQLKKLKHLSIISITAKTKNIPYSVLLEELCLNNIRDLEDMIIEAIYLGIMNGKLDQRNARFEVDYAIGRDILPNDVEQLIRMLQPWHDNCSTVLSSIQGQIRYANLGKAKHSQKMEIMHQQINIIENTLKKNSMDIDEKD